jgi:hypothetical protein
VNGNFETPPYDTPGTVAGWTTSGPGQIEAKIQGSTSPTHSAAFGTGGDSQDNMLSQRFNTIVGRTYSVDFDAGIFGQRSGVPMQLQVQVVGGGTLLNQTVTPPYAGTFTPSSVVFQHYHYTFTANSTVTTLQFKDVGLGNAIADTVLDSVSVVLQPIPTPTPALTFSVSASPTTINEGGIATYRISVSPVPSQPVTVPYAMSGKASNGTDYTLSSIGQVVIPAGAPSVNVFLHALPDSVSEKRETAIMTVQNITSKRSSSSSATVTIVNVR